MCEQRQDDRHDDCRGGDTNTQNSHGFINVANGDNVNILSGNFSQGYTGGNNIGGEHNNVFHV